jgi:hypothetical protein
MHRALRLVREIGAVQEKRLPHPPYACEPIIFQLNFTFTYTAHVRSMYSDAALSRFCVNGKA